MKNNILIVGSDTALQEKVYEFLVDTANIEGVNKAILPNAVVLLDEEQKVLGTATFEKLAPDSAFGLLRYFIFKSHIDNEDVQELVVRLSTWAKADGCAGIFGVFKKPELVSFFEELGFSTSEQLAAKLKEILPTQLEGATILLRGT